jgi:hypothetical protein
MKLGWQNRTPIGEIIFDPTANPHNYFSFLTMRFPGLWILRDFDNEKIHVVEQKKEN